MREAEVFSLIPGSLCGVNVWGQTWAILILRIKPKRWVRAQKSFFPNPPKLHRAFPMVMSSSLYCVPFQFPHWNEWEFISLRLTRAPCFLEWGVLLGSFPRALVPLLGGWLDPDSLELPQKGHSPSSEPARPAQYSPTQYSHAPLAWRGTKKRNASRICVSSFRRGHANLLCIDPILVYVLPWQAQAPQMVLYLI